MRFIGILLIIMISATCVMAWEKRLSPTYVEYCNGNTCTVSISSHVLNYYNGSEYVEIDPNYKDINLTISGRDYIFGVDKGMYQSYFREQSSSTYTRPMAIKYGNYYFTYSPQEYILFEPHKYGVNGRIANKQQSYAVNDSNYVIYPNQYKEQTTTDDFANLSYKYTGDFLKEDLILWDKNYVQERFNSQCNEEDYDITYLTFTQIIRSYLIDDTDNNTLGIFYNKDKVSFKEFGLSANGEFTTTDEVYFTDENNDTIFYIPYLYAYDSNDNSILLNKTVSMTDFGNLKIKVLTPFNWLNDTDTLYPVYIDPTVHLIASDVSLDDTWADNNSPQVNYGDSGNLNTIAYYNFTGIFESVNNAWKKIGLHSLTNVDYISDAQLCAYYTGNFLETNDNITIWSLANETWNELNVTWDWRPGGALTELITYDGSTLTNQYICQNFTEFVNTSYFSGVRNISFMWNLTAGDNSELPVWDDHIQFFDNDDERSSDKWTYMNITYTKTSCEPCPGELKCLWNISLADYCIIRDVIKPNQYVNWTESGNVTFGSNVWVSDFYMIPSGSKMWIQDDLAMRLSHWNPQ